jgi:SAM-dependent methyltransferase
VEYLLRPRSEILDMTVLVVSDQKRPDLGGNLRGGDSAAFTPKLWRYLVERFAVRSVLDVGCGEGYAVSFFHDLGLHAHGIDGLPLNVQRAVIPIAHHDLTSGRYFMPVDMAISIEVAEHIAPEHVDNFLDTLANGRVICMTAAPPGQDGHHHVNCQPAQYWIEHLLKRDYFLSEENDHFKAMCNSEVRYKYFSESGLIFLHA